MVRQYLAERQGTWSDPVDDVITAEMGSGVLNSRTLIQYISQIVGMYLMRRVIRSHKICSTG